MPKNVQDFKDHPVYALERHLRRNEVIIAERESGTVATGSTSSGSKKKLENVYRRKDVHICRSAEAWYRLGREIKPDAQPAKSVPSRARKHDLSNDEGAGENPGTDLYTEAQTTLYIPPPVVNGRVPKNSFGNIDVYVPSMVPKGGVHIDVEGPDAMYAARLLGVDFASALTGWVFRGRHGTAALRGVVVAREFKEAVESVVEGIAEEREREREEERRERVLRLWRRWLVGLRVRERVGAYFEVGQEEGEEKEEEYPGRVEGGEDGSDSGDEGGGEADEGGFVKEDETPGTGEEGGFAKGDEKVESDDSSELSDTYTDDDYDDDMGGGFIPE